MINYRGFTLNQPGTQAPWGKVEFDLFKSMIDTILDTSQPWTTVYEGAWIDSIPSANAMTYGVTQDDKPTGTAWVRVTTSAGEFVGVCNPNNTFSKFGNATYDDECNTLFSTTFKDVADNVLEGFGYITNDLDDQNNSTYLALVKAGNMTENIKIEFLSSSSVLFTTVTPSANYTTLSSISVRGNDSFKPVSFYSMQQAIIAPDQDNTFASIAELQTLINDGYREVYYSPSGSGLSGTLTLPYGKEIRIKSNTMDGPELSGNLNIVFGSGSGYIGSLNIDAIQLNGHTLSIDERIGQLGPHAEILTVYDTGTIETKDYTSQPATVRLGKVINSSLTVNNINVFYEDSERDIAKIGPHSLEKVYWRTPTTLDNTCSSTAEMQALIDAGFEEVFAAGDGSFSGTLNIPFGSNVKIKSSSVIGLVMTGDFSVSLGSGTGYWGSIEFDFVRTGGNTLTIDSQYQNVRIKKLKVEGNSTLASSTTLGDIWINKITGTDTLTVEDTNLHYEEIVGPVIATTGVGTADQGFWWTPTALDNTCSSTAEMQALIDAGHQEVVVSPDDEFAGGFSGEIIIPHGVDFRIKTSEGQPATVGMKLTGDLTIKHGSGSGYLGSLKILGTVYSEGHTLTIDERYGSLGPNMELDRFVSADATINNTSTGSDTSNMYIGKIHIAEGFDLNVFRVYIEYEESNKEIVAPPGFQGTYNQWKSTIPRILKNDLGDVELSPADGSAVIIPNEATVKTKDGNVLLEVQSTGDDAGLALKGGQFSVGSSGNGKESVFGEGDSVPMNYAFHCTRGDTTGDTIINAVDITEILTSDSGSTTGLFGGTATGNYILVGYDQQFQGVKIKSTDCGTVEPENVELASWRVGGNKFVTRFMNTNADFPYTQYGNAVCVVPSEQWRFGFDPTTPSTWVQNTLNINGQDITQYWGIFEIITPITQDATIEQMKLHTNRAEMNADGKLEFFGLSRYPRTVQSGQGATITNSIFNPQNEAVPYGANFSALFTDNQLTDGATDGFGIQQGIESGMDTSIPLQLIISYYPSLGVTGDVEFTIEVFQVNDGFVHDGTAVPETTTVIDTISAPSSGVRRSVSVLIYADTLTDDGDNLMISVYRDATVGNANDTLASNIIIENVTLKAYFWGP